MRVPERAEAVAPDAVSVFPWRVKSPVAAHTQPVFNMPEDCSTHERLSVAAGSCTSIDQERPVAGMVL